MPGTHSINWLLCGYIFPLHLKLEPFEYGLLCCKLAPAAQAKNLCNNRRASGNNYPCSRVKPVYVLAHGRAQMSMNFWKMRFCCLNPKWYFFFLFFSGSTVGIHFIFYFTLQYCIGFASIKKIPFISISYKKWMVFF